MQLPQLEGYLTPIPLWQFLRQYFFISVGIPTEHETPAENDALMRIPFDHRNPGGAVFCYVSQVAPPPTISLEHNFFGKEMLCDRLINRGAAAARWGDPFRRPLATQVLRAHMFWDELLSYCVNEDETTLWEPLKNLATLPEFLHSFCVVVIQLEPSMGCLRLIGATPIQGEQQGRPFVRRRQWATNRGKQPRTCGKLTKERAAPISSTSHLFRRSISRSPLFDDQRYVALVRDNLCWISQGNETTADLAKCVSVSKLIRSLPYSCSLADRVNVEQVVDKLAEKNSLKCSSLLKEHIYRVMSALLQSMEAVNVRGMILRHLGSFESKLLPQELTCGTLNNSMNSFLVVRKLLKRQSFSNGVFAPPVRAGIVPRKIVLEYLTDVLSQIRFPSSPSLVSFWGPAENLTELVKGISKWIDCGGDSTVEFAAANLLQNMKVGQIPWLEGCTLHKHRCSRSKTQQELFLAILPLIFEVVIPFFLRRAFYVTWEPRSGRRRDFLFFPIRVYSWWCKCYRFSVTRSESTLLRLRKLTSSSLRRSYSQCSPLPRGLVLYSSIRLLPDRSKLRPIATIRCGTEKALQRLIQRRPITNIGLQNRPKSAECATPNKSVLRQCLMCLHYGFSLRKQGKNNLSSAGMFRPFSSSEFLEYNALLNYKLQLCHGQESESAHLPVTVYCLRVDGHRCYDRLPQTVVARLINQLICCEKYYIATFRLISADKNRQSPRCRIWRQVLSKDDWSSGMLRSIPAHCIVEEGISRYNEGLCTSQSPPIAVIEVNGEYVRNLLLHHLTNHIVVLRGGAVFEQRLGIPQGSAVASLFCDALLEEGIDTVLLHDVFPEYPEEPILFLRRADDVFFSTTSHQLFDRVLRFLRDGSPESGVSCVDFGYVSNRDKLQLLSFYFAHPYTNEIPTDCTTIKWCGYCISPSSLQCSVDWDRFRSAAQVSLQTSLVHHLQVPPKTMLMESTCRVLRMVQLRSGVCCFCTILNSDNQILRTIASMCFQVSHWIVELVCRMQCGCTNIFTPIQDVVCEMVRGKVPPFRDGALHLALVLCPLRLSCRFIQHFISVKHEESLSFASRATNVFSEDLTRAIFLAVLHYSITQQLSLLIRCVRRCLSVGPWTKQLTRLCLFWCAARSVVGGFLQETLREKSDVQKHLFELSSSPVSTLDKLFKELFAFE